VRHLMEVHKVGKERALRMNEKAVKRARAFALGAVETNGEISKKRCRQIFGPLFDSPGFEVLLKQCLMETGGSIVSESEPEPDSVSKEEAREREQESEGEVNEVRERTHVGKVG